MNVVNLERPSSHPLFSSQSRVKHYIVRVFAVNGVDHVRPFVDKRLIGKICSTANECTEETLMETKTLQTVKVEKEDGITWVILNRPEKRNAMSPQLHFDM